MNTRLQVEHPVTELVTGLDLVRLQLEIAGGRAPAVHAGSDRAARRGDRVPYLCRRSREQFLAVTRPNHATREPSGPGVRLDSGIYPGWNVPLDYDPMLAKLIVWAERREHAIERMLRALGEYHIGGIRTNIPLFG